MRSLVRAALALSLSGVAACFSYDPPDADEIPDLADGDLITGCSAEGCKGGPLPVCDPMSQRCVACLTDFDCALGTICRLNACVPGCTGTHGCPPGQGQCNTGTHQCFLCHSDADCLNPHPRCDPNSMQCVACLPQNDNCLADTYCTSVNGVNTCVQGCKDDGDCNLPDGGVAQMGCCNHLCIDVASNDKHCGGCNTACNGQHCCAGSCSDTSQDPANCGGCGIACAGQNATWTCNAGFCAIAGCTGSHADCDKSAGDGCEVDLTSDPANCTACGMKCQVPNAVESCKNGCTFGGCAPGFSDCNNNLGDGCEINTDSDNDSCGKCGKRCAVANGSPACVKGVCALASCDTGYADCDGNLANGCEIDIDIDVQNCGGCMQKCVGLPNAQSSTCNVTCMLDCKVDFADCDGDTSNGCEVNTVNDPSNCNGCGNVCTFANASGSCSNGACQLEVCDVGWANCNGDPGDGCETDITGDRNNCNGCNNTCGNNQVCKNGQCVAGAIYSDQFFLNQTPNQQCTDWNDFRATLGNGYNSITISGSFDQVGVTCVNSGNNEPDQLAGLLRNNAGGQVFCGGHTWYTDGCGNSLEINVDAGNCNCDNNNNGYAVRPCIGNPNWGGAGTMICSPPDQTLTLVLQ